MKISEFFVRENDPKKGICFVLMPFDGEMTAVYEHGIKPLVEDMGLICRRADEIYSTQNILGDIWEAIQTAEIIIADLTGKNPNVMYELGLCHMIWKKVILLSQNKDDVPFDLKQWRVLWYDFTFQGSARLKEELQRAIDTVRQESDIEGKIVPIDFQTHDKPLDTFKSSSLPDNAWHFGEITAWNATKKNGFIESNGDTFYSNQNYLFSRKWTPEKGDKVIFKTLEALPNGKNPRATEVFIEGCSISGKIVNDKEDYCFIEIQNQEFQTHSLFVYKGEEFEAEKGQIINTTISKNPKGPIGQGIELFSTQLD